MVRSRDSEKSVVPHNFADGGEMVARAMVVRARIKNLRMISKASNNPNGLNIWLRETFDDSIFGYGSCLAQCACF